MVLKPTGISAGETSTTTNTVASTEEIEGGNDDSFRDNEAVENSDKGAASGSGSAPKKMNWAAMVVIRYSRYRKGKCGQLCNYDRCRCQRKDSSKESVETSDVAGAAKSEKEKQKKSDEKSGSSTKSKSEATAKQSPAPKESK